MSKVTSVDAELNVAASDDISAAISAATMKPTRPVGSSRMTSVGYAASPADVRIERPGDEPRQHEDEDRQDLQEAAEERAAARVRFVLGAEHALHDHLIGAPVPDAEDRRAEEDAGPRERRVATTA